MFRGFDLAPAGHSLASESIPKSAARILNAAKVRAEFKEKKRQLELEAEGEADDQNGRAKKRRKGTENESDLGAVAGKKMTLKLQPGESIQHFNKCV
jgi:hypothetical protein